MLVRLEACGVCHTDMYTASGADPSGLRAHGAGPRGRRHRREGGPGRVAGARGRPRGHAVQPPVRRVRALHQPAHQPVPGHPRGAGQGPPARRHHPPEPRRRGHPPLHGHLHVRRVHGDAGDRAGGGQPRRPGRPRVRVRLRAVHRPGRRHQHRGRGARLDRGGLRRRPGGPGRRGRRAAAGRRADRVRRPVRGAAGDGARPGRHRHVRGRARQRGAGAGDDRRHGRRLHLRGHRQREGDAPGGGVGAHGLGPVHRDRRGRQGRDAGRDPALPDHRPADRRARRSAA